MTGALALADAPYDTVKLHAALLAVLAEWRFTRHERNAMRRATQTFVAALDTCGGTTLEERWTEFERRVWPEWLAGRRPSRDNRWAGGLRLAVLGRQELPDHAVAAEQCFGCLRVLRWSSQCANRRDCLLDPLT